MEILQTFISLSICYPSDKHIYIYIYIYDGIPSQLMASMLEGNIVGSKFKLQSCYYVRFQTYTHGKGMNFLIFPAMS